MTSISKTDRSYHPKPVRPGFYLSFLQQIQQQQQFIKVFAFTYMALPILFKK